MKQLEEIKQQVGKVGVLGYSAEQYAEIINKTTKTVYNYIHAGHLKAIKVGLHSYIIPHSEVERLLVE